MQIQLLKFDDSKCVLAVLQTGTTTAAYGYAAIMCGLSRIIHLFTVLVGQTQTEAQNCLQLVFRFVSGPTNFEDNSLWIIFPDFLPLCLKHQGNTSLRDCFLLSDTLESLCFQNIIKHILHFLKVRYISALLHPMVMIIYAYLY
jgi:hypothetical protein